MASGDRGGYYTPTHVSEHIPGTDEDADEDPTPPQTLCRCSARRMLLFYSTVEYFFLVQYIVPRMGNMGIIG